VNSLFWYPGHELSLANIVRGDNCRLYDADGRMYVDLESGVWCTALGHGHPRVVKAMARQAALLAHTGFSFSTPIVEEAARVILALHGFDGGKCVFLSSGSEAVEFGVRVAEAVKPRPLLMTMADSYFGAYGSAARKAEDGWFVFDGSVCGKCPHSGPCADGCDHWRRIPFDRIGGFVFEPGSSSGLVRFPPEKLITRIAEEVKTGNGILVVNEVTTGFGRTGRWFGYQHYEVAPDIVSMGKGLGNGYPVSAAVLSPALTDRIGDRGIHYSQSHQNDPLGAAVAREVVRTIEEEGLIERAGRIGQRLADRLAAIRRRCERIEDVRIRGLMAAVELTDGPGAPFTAQVRRSLLENGYVVAQRPGLNVLRLDPGLTIDEADIMGFLAALEEILNRTGGR
jgi:acetylornithine aminotransferase